MRANSTLPALAAVSNGVNQSSAPPLAATRCAAGNGGASARSSAAVRPTGNTTRPLSGGACDASRAAWPDW